MFAYCLNNPVMYSDPAGTCITNAMGMTIHYNCNYDPRRQFSVLSSVSKNTLDYNIIEKESYGFKMTTGVSLSESKGNKKNALITVETNTTTYVTKNTLGTSYSVKNNINNTAISIGTEGASFTNTYDFGKIEISQTYSVTTEGYLEYTGECSICWDNTEVTFYSTVGVSDLIVITLALSGAYCMEPIPVKVPAKF